MSDAINDRKLQHIRIIESDAETDRARRYFDRIRLTHQALPECALDEVDASVDFLGKRLSFPLLISCMTGGAQDVVRAVNRRLAEAAEATGVAMGVGSQRVAFAHAEARASFALRGLAPGVPLLANLGAVQLNYGFTVEHAREAVEMLEADALVLHLNPLQEAVQPEGDTDFRGLLDKIAGVVSALDVPVILKEVGAGISADRAETLLAMGIRYIDVAGSGGTSWSRIEHHRQGETDGHDLGLLFQDWGIPTPVALRQWRPYGDRVTLIASGGIRTGLDMVKAVVLGASLCGVAAPFLKPAMESTERVVEVIERLKRAFVTGLFLLGARSVDEVRGRESLILEER